MRFRFMFMCVLLVLAMTATYAAAAPIHDAAGKGNLAKVKALLKKAPKLVNLADKDGATPLHYATSGNHKSVVELLLSKNANVNAKKKDGVTPLHIAAAMGRTEIAKLFLTKNAKVDAVDNKDRTPISLAEESGRVEMIELLTAVEGRSPAAAIAPGALVGDVRINPKDGQVMLLVPAVEFIMGSEDGKVDEKPAHKLNLPAYYIGKTEVTVAQFRRFVTETGYAPEGKWQTPTNYPGFNEQWPVTHVSSRDIASYCRWAGLRLPTEAEWEKAARGTDGRTWPWGNSWDYSKSNSAPPDDTRGCKSVGSFPGGASPYGCLDMAGNVWEWTSSQYRQYPYDPKDGREADSPDANRVIRGGSCANGDQSARSTGRVSSDVQGNGGADLGFRCAKSVE